MQKAKQDQVRRH